ncbi:hypothetical protein HYC85_014958 [Camellia sinensis]|uniref:MIF4G-like type 1 domain-containing protein n=1 Tax=Camellia sinensis TaxID=4442 RepID=A0A7J7H9S9_CAMSI|nr:hypothetical protein HYC85_014958 [Camellia sinensis]
MTSRFDRFDPTVEPVTRPPGPFSGSLTGPQVPEEIERVMVGIEAYLRIRRHTSDIGFAIFEDVNYTEKALDEKDFLEDLWGRIQDLSSNGWKLESFRSHYSVNFIPSLIVLCINHINLLVPHLSFEAQLVAGKAHDLEAINCPEQPDPPAILSAITCGKQKQEAELKYPQRICRLNDLQPIDRFVVEEYLLDVLLFLNGWRGTRRILEGYASRKECASCMVGLPVPFRHEYLMAETIFSHLLLLPHPLFKPMYYTLVIIDLCKTLPGAFPAVVAGAVRALFDKIADLDMEYQTRLILWFSHHLSGKSVSRFWVAGREEEAMFFGLLSVSAK